ncbi:MAG: SUMF1/EgtB/PvdO family nonheme iron enzyme, partial [Planctomycetota bacterium]
MMAGRSWMIAALGLVTAWALSAAAVEKPEEFWAGQPQYAATAAELERSIGLAIDDIELTFGDRYAAAGYRARLAAAAGDVDALRVLQREALFANPALDFDDIIVLRRRFADDRQALKGFGEKMGLVRGNFNSLACAERSGWDDAICRLRDFRTAAELETIHANNHGGLINEIDLHFDAERMMFSQTDAGGTWRVLEVGVDGTGLRQVTPDDGADVDHFDSCYLPSGGVIFASTGTFQGMPCIKGEPRMASLYRQDAAGAVRQLGFDQDTAWCPTVLNDGRIMYTRWEYSDMVHSNNRPLMVMNPDGTGQKSIYGSNSYFPAAFNYVRPIPGHPSMVVGVAGGHHGIPRCGRMLLVDPAQGQREDEGVVAQVPGRGTQVKRTPRDSYTNGVLPLTIHPYPLAERGTHHGAGKYFLVAMRPNWDTLWGIYLVDVFDNAVLIKEVAGEGLLEPIPLRGNDVPAQIPDMVDLTTTTATAYIQDIYHGPGLADVPKGTVKKLRIGGYQFSAHGSGGGHVGTIGVDSGWDIKRILGTVPVNEDGSAYFEIPANTPIFFQPLDEQGRSLQGMRTWATAMPGERMSCVGCHESAYDAPLPQVTTASTQDPDVIEPWQGPARPFSFRHEIQPILDANCVSCHDGQPVDGRYDTTRSDYVGRPIPNLTNTPISDWRQKVSGGAQWVGGRFTEAYVALHALVRHPGIESPMAVPNAGEYAANVGELVHLLEKGHHGVQLSEDEWQALYCWIDLNAPQVGYRYDMYSPESQKGEGVATSFRRGRELAEKYACGMTDFIDIDPPAQPVVVTEPIPGQEPERAQRAAGRQAFVAEIIATGEPAVRALELGAGQSLELVRLPGGRFTMGSDSGALDELPMHQLTIRPGLWMGRYEVTNAQLRAFAAEHSSRFEDRHFYQFGVECYDVDGDELPAVRVSHQMATAFCAWLSERSGVTVRLPTESEWEWACRAGQGSDYSFTAAAPAALDLGPSSGGNFAAGSAGDWAAFANLADRSIQDYHVNPYGEPWDTSRLYNRSDVTRYEAWLPYVASVDDGSQLQCTPGSYAANAWGLHDMHGNVAEWTSSAYAPYPYGADDGREAMGDAHTRRVVRGGSAYD